MLDGERLLELALGDLATAADVMVRQGDTIARAGTEPDDARFLLFSLSKTLTAVAVLVLVDANALTLDTRVADVIPEFGANGKDAVSVADVLAHRGGFPDATAGDAPLGLRDFADWERAVARICGARSDPRLVGVPTYHAFSYSILAAVVERVTNDGFATFCQASVFAPLGMDRTTWGLPGARDRAVAMVGPTATEWNDDVLLAEAVVPAGNAWSTAEDVGALFAMLAAGGSYRRRRVLSEGIVREMLRPQGPASGQAGAWAFGLGVLVGAEPGHSCSFGRTASRSCFGHPGFTATTAWHDPASDATLVALTNSSVDQAASDRRFATLSDAIRGFERPASAAIGSA